MRAQMKTKLGKSKKSPSQNFDETRVLEGEWFIADNFKHSDIKMYH